MVGELEERGIYLHLAREHWAQPFVCFIPCRNIFRPRRKLAFRRDDAELFLPGKRFLAHLVPALVELAFVLRDPVLRYVVRGVRYSRRKVDEERLVGRNRLLLADVTDRLIGKVFHQMVAFLGCSLRFDRRRSFIKRWVVLVVLSADEPIEMLEAGASGPAIIGANRCGFEDGHLVALTELRGRITVEL